MVFTAKIVKHSHLWKMWRSRHAVSGQVGDVLFRLISVDEYESGELTADQVGRLRTVVGVHLTSFGEPAPEQQPVRVVMPVIEPSIGSKTLRLPERSSGSKRR